MLWVSQLTAGRKNCMRYEIAGARSSIWFDSERPNELWLGHRERPNELIFKDPGLMDASVRRYWVELLEGRRRLQPAPWYAPVAVAVTEAAWLLGRYTKAGLSPLNKDQNADLLFALVIGVLVGGRLGYFLLYTPGELFDRRLSILRVWDGVGSTFVLLRKR